MKPVATRLAVFLALAVAAYFLTGTIAGTPLGFSVLFAALLVLATVGCARFNKESLALRLRRGVGAVRRDRADLRPRYPRVLA